MGNFDEIMKADAAATIGNADEFGEEAVYVGRHDGTAISRDITITVQRSPAAFPRAMPEAPGSMGYKFKVTVINDAVKGISRQELVVGADRIQFAEKQGDAEKVEFRIVGVEFEDAGAMTLRVQ